jgi:hypothetical protein
MWDEQGRWTRFSLSTGGFTSKHSSYSLQMTDALLQESAGEGQYSFR